MKIVNIGYDNWKSVDGCPTCNYGSIYVDNIRIIFEDNSYIEFHSEVENIGCALSESDWMIILGNSNTKTEIIEAWMSKIKDYLPNEDIYYTDGWVWSNESTKHWPDRGSDQDDTRDNI